MDKIPFNKVYLTGKEKEYIADALKKRTISGDGFYTELVSKFLEKKFKLNKVLMTTSATHALELAAQLINLKEGDEVIMPSFTFSSTANAVIKEGAQPVFAEIDSQYLNLDPADFKAKITSKTKAVIPVHYAGISCEMEEIKKIAAANNITVIADAAHGVNSFYQGKAVGAHADLACYSFHETKNFVCGEGGALIINNNDFDWIKKAEIIRENGTNRSRFLAGEIDKYSWVNQGSSYLPSDILMAFLYAQLEELDYITGQRKKIFDYYNKNFKAYLNKDFLASIPSVPADRKSNYHIYHLRFKNSEIRDFTLKKLKENGIEASFHFQPLHRSVMGQKLGYKKEDLAKSSQLADSILRLPIYPDLSRAEQDYIVRVVLKTFEEIIQAGV